MFPKKSLILLFAGCIGTLWGAGTRNLSVQYAVKTDSEIKIDGKLDESAWATAPEYTDYRFGSRPRATPLKTSIRILWGRHGIYFGIINYTKKGYQLKTTIRTRDGGWIWADDSCEFYIDPKANGYGLFKFDVNSAGAIGDFWQIDPGNTDFGYTASSAIAACQLNEDNWTMEFYVSYADLHTDVPKEGQIWAIMHRRLDYTEGSLCDMSTSGGHYWNKQFGYVFLTKDGKLPAQTVLDNLKRYANAPWLAQIGDLYFWTDGKTEVSGSAEHILTYFRKLLNEEMAKVNSEQQKAFQEKAAAVKTVDSAVIISMTKLLDEVKALQKKNQLDELFD